MFQKKLETLSMIPVQAGSFILLASFWGVHGFVSVLIQQTNRIQKVTFKRLGRRGIVDVERKNRVQRKRWLGENLAK